MHFRCNKQTQPSCYMRLCLLSWNLICSLSSYFLSTPPHSLPLCSPLLAPFPIYRGLNWFLQLLFQCLRTGNGLLRKNRVTIGCRYSSIFYVRNWRSSFKIEFPALSSIYANKVDYISAGLFSTPPPVGCNLSIFWGSFERPVAVLNARSPLFYRQCIPAGYF